VRRYRRRLKKSTGHDAPGCNLSSAIRVFVTGMPRANKLRESAGRLAETWEAVPDQDRHGMVEGMRGIAKHTTQSARQLAQVFINHEPEE
jgi:hypothetical protein